MKLKNKELALPIIQGGMGVGVSLSGLAGAVAACGGMGVISGVNCGFGEADFKENPLEANLRALKREIRKAKEIATGKGMVAVNMMVAANHYDKHCQAAVEAGADAIISGAGLPVQLPEYTKGSQTLCAPVVSSAKAAKLLCKKYLCKYEILPDFFVFEGYKAGGHLGFSAEELLEHKAKENDEILLEILEAVAQYHIPVFVAGGVFTKEDVEHYLGLGAAGVQIGTRFIATEECDAHDVFKQAIIQAKKEDIKIITSPVGMPARAINSPLLERVAKGEKFLAKPCSNCLTQCPKGDKIPYCISRALIESVNGNWEDGLFFTGENAWRIDRMTTVAELMAELVSDTITVSDTSNDTSTKYAFLYAGQGAQKVGMGKDFYEKYETYRKIADSFTFEFDHRELMHEGPLELLSQTEYTQPCMSIFAAGVTEVLKENGIIAEAALGLSLGEYGALYAAGVFDYKSYVEITKFRGSQMAQAAKGKSCAMSAVLGLSAEAVEEIVNEIQNQQPELGYLTVANYNCPKQYVICGEEEAVAAAEIALKEKGAMRCIRLNVSGPFHTKYMAAAGEALREYFFKIDFAKAQIPVLLNYTGDYYKEGDDLKELLVAQVQNSVRLEASIKKLLEEDVDCFIEIGPGNTLTGFLKKCAREMKKKVKIVSIESVADLEKLLLAKER